MAMISVSGNDRMICCTCGRYQNWRRNHCYDDSRLRLFSIIGKEWFEILIQIYALFLYGGINLFDKDSNVLAQDPNIVRGKDNSQYDFFF